MNITVHSSSSGPEDSLPGVVLKASSLLLLILVGAYGNARVIYTVLAVDVLRPVLNLCIASLSLADFAICTGLMPVAFLSLIRGEWLFNHASYVAHNMLLVYFGQVAALSITAIVYERYRAIVRRYFPSLSSSQTYVLLLAIWSSPIPFIIPKFRQEMVYFASTGMCFNNYTLHSTEWNAIYISNAVFTSLSLFVILFSFWKIFGVLLPLRVRVSPGLLSNEQKVTVAAHVRSASTSILFVLIYVILALPLYITLAVDQQRKYLGESGISDAVRCTFLWFFWLQCPVKPIIYALRSERSIGGLFCCFQTRRVEIVRTDSFRRPSGRSRNYELDEDIRDYLQNSMSEQTARCVTITREEFHDIHMFPGFGHEVPSSRLNRSFPEQGRVLSEDARPQTGFPNVVIRACIQRESSAAFVVEHNVEVWSGEEEIRRQDSEIETIPCQDATCRACHTEDASPIPLDICDDPTGLESIEHIFNDALQAQERFWAKKRSQVTFQ